MMALNFPLIASMAPQIPQKKPDWRASLFDRLMPDGDGLDDGDKEAAMRQGLLGLASGLLGTGGGFGNALSAGIQNGLLATNQSVDSQQDRQYRKQMMERQMGDPAGLREFQALAEAAGYQPGTEDYQQAARTRLGTVGRASSAGFSQVEFVDGEGRPRIGSFNGKTGQIDLPDGTSWSPGQGYTPTIQSQSGAPYTIDPSLPPQVQAAIRGNEQAWAQAPDQSAMQIPQGSSPFVGRRKEDEAAAVAAAEERAKLSMMPTRNALEAQGAGMTTAAQERARIAAEFGSYDAMTKKVADRASAEARARAAAEADATAGKKSLDAMDTLGLLDVAEELVNQSTGSGAGAVVDTAAGFFGQSSEGADAIASLQTIQGQLISKMPRMEGPQSDKDVDLYKDMAGRLADPWRPKSQRLAAAATIRMLNERYAKPAEPAEPSLDSLTDEDLLRQLGGN